MMGPREPPPDERGEDGRTSCVSSRWGHHPMPRRDPAHRSLSTSCGYDPSTQKPLSWGSSRSPGEKAGFPSPARDIGSVPREVWSCRYPHPLQRILPPCLLYTSDAADDLLCVDLGGRRIIKKKKKKKITDTTPESQK